MNLRLSSKWPIPIKVKSTGFTIVEVLVSIVVLTIFITAAFQVYRLIENERNVLAKRSIANEIAYINLQKFPTKPTSLTACSTNPIGIDLKSFNNYSDETTTTYPALSIFGSTPPDQSVKGFPVGSCDVGGVFVANAAFKIESKVTYYEGTVQRTVTRTAIVSQ